MAGDTCDICNGEVEGCKVLGVYAVPGAPVSIAYGSICASHNAFPAWIFEHDFIFVSNGDPEALNEWARNRVCWDSKSKTYVVYDEYVKRITKEEIDKQWKGYLEAADKSREKEDA